MAKHPTYGEAVMCMIANERLDWVDSPDPKFPDTVMMMADLFAVSSSQILLDVRATLNSAGKK